MLLLLLSCEALVFSKHVDLVLQVAADECLRWGGVGGSVEK